MSKFKCDVVVEIYVLFIHAHCICLYLKLFHYNVLGIIAIILISHRLIPIADTWLSRSETRNTDNILVTSSTDRTIRLWWKVLFSKFCRNPICTCFLFCAKFSDNRDYPPNDLHW